MSVYLHVGTETFPSLGVTEHADSDAAMHHLTASLGENFTGQIRIDSHTETDYVLSDADVYGAILTSLGAGVLIFRVTRDAVLTSAV